jgi:YebC/PmpR family DNA-binding regulatory protein
VAGHSKWANIKHRKARADAQKSNLFSKLVREIIVAARHGGGNPDSNLRLKLAIQKAREHNLASESVARAIRRGTGELDGANLEELTYEAFGPAGAALLIESVTDNRNRTTADLRYILSRNHGSLAEAGAVAWMFKRRGYIAIERSGCPLDEDALLLLAAAAGAEDLTAGDEAYELYMAPEDLATIEETLRRAGVQAETAETTMVAQTTVQLGGEEARAVLRLIDALEAHDDVQRVHTNVELALESVDL